MRQTFPFAHPRHAPPQALAALKNRIRKYIKRERRKQLPEGADYWDFDCKIGPREESATVAHVAELIPRMGDLCSEGSTHVYVEILAKPARRQRRQKTPSDAD